jgi:hypothetical protein
METTPSASGTTPAAPPAAPTGDPPTEVTDTVEKLNTNEPTTTADLKAAYEFVAEFPLKGNAGVSFVVVKGTKEGTQIVGSQDHKLFIQSAIDSQISTEFYTITHSGGIQTSIK